MRYLYLHLMLLALLLVCGCSTTYVPISWNYGDKVKKLSNTDTTLKILFSHYDPQRQTLRVRAASFEEVMMPYEVKYHLGAYRPDTRILYRNLYHEYDEKELRDVMVHEFAHHIWFSYMSADQRDKWKQHLALNPSPLQAMVRSIYSRATEHDTEDFAFVVSHPRRIDIEKLASLNIINEAERDDLIKELEKPIQPPKKSPVVVAGPGPAKAATASEKSASVGAPDPASDKAAAASEKPLPAPGAGSSAASAPGTEKAPAPAAAPEKTAASSETPVPAPVPGSAVAPEAAPETAGAPSPPAAPAPATDHVAASASEPATTPAPPVMDKGHH